MEDQPLVTTPIREICVSCGAKLKGDYCRKCGEKKIIPERDFRLSKFLNQTMWHFVRFDSKLLKSVWLLFSKPGFLTAEWIIGRRVGYMKPVQLFVIASLLFYFFLPTVPAYYISPDDLIKGYHERNYFRNTSQYDFEKLLMEKASKAGMDEKSYSDTIATIAARQSKTWLFLYIPVWGSLFYFFFRKKLPWLAPNLIFAMHSITFNLFADLSIHAFLNIFSIIPNGAYIFFGLMGIIFTYQTFAVRRVNLDSWMVSIMKAFGITVGLIVIDMVYRQLITVGVIMAH